MSKKVLRRWSQPIASLTIIGICAVIFLIEYFIPSLYTYNHLQFRPPVRLDWLPFTLSPVFLHFTWLHICMNLVMFWFFARQIEALIGSWCVWGLLIVVGLVSNIAQFIVSGPAFGGLSGVVMGCVSFVWAGTLHKPQFGFYVPSGLIVFLLISLVLGFFGVLDFIFGPIANTAHGVGFLTGFICWPIFYSLKVIFSKLSSFYR